MAGKKLFLAGAALAPLLILALGGLALAHWTDDVAVQGSVSMGYLIWDIETATLAGNTNHYMDFDWDVSDPGDDIAPGDPGGPLLGTYTGLIDARIKYAYPGAYGAAVVEAQNEGSIPVRIYVWVEPGPLADPTDPAYKPACATLLNYILLNPGYDALDHALNNDDDPLISDDVDVAGNFGGSIDPYDPGDYNAPERVAGGWDEFLGYYTGSGVNLTMSVADWITLTGSASNAVPLESTHTSGNIIVISYGALSHDSDNVLEPGESTYIFVWIGFDNVSDDNLQDHEELMNTDCTSDVLFKIHYVAVQAVP